MRASGSPVFVAAVLAFGAPAPARAAPSVTATDTAGATGLTLDGEGGASTHIVKVADLALATDGVEGFTVSITSGALTKAGGTSITFQVALVDDNAGAPAAGAFTAASGAPYLFATTGPSTVEKDLYIKYTPASLQDPGGYTAAIDIDVVDN